ncbi:unnamed protein product [Orchesella dallaii]|uniref:Helicase ATP-binding domain-containing protein n=1 Tax=Orchesella dallaii TaxID=48710 RepID=A0ABP1Q9N4_9HEXA
MGDVVYPGVQLTKGHSHVDERDVLEAIYRSIGPASTQFYHNGAPVVTILRLGTHPTNIIISGILRSYNDIRRALATQRIRGHISQFQDVDFHATRHANGRVIFLHKPLHDHLSESQGFLLETIPGIIQDDFRFAKLGGWRDITNTITIAANLQHCNLAMLRESGSYLYHWGGSIDRTRTKIYFVFVADAIQAIMHLNCNTNFVANGARFVTRYECSYNGQDYFGIDGTFLNSTDLMARVGYIPFKNFNQLVIANDLEDRFKTTCQICDDEIELLGVNADLTWFAVFCDCRRTGALIHWNTENFFRFIPNPPIAAKMNKYEDIPDPRDRLIQFIKGQVPEFKNALEFRSSGYAASVAEFRESRNETRSNHSQIVQILESTYLDTTIDDRMRYTIRFLTAKTSLWNEEKVGGIDKLSFRPLKKDCALKMGQTAHPADIGTGNTWFPGKFHELEEVGENVVVTANANVRQSQTIPVGQLYYVVPSPPQLPLVSLASIIKKWITFEHLREIQMLRGFLKVAIHREDMYHQMYRARISFYYLQVSVPPRYVLQLKDNITDANYMGCELWIDVTHRNDQTNQFVAKRTGRLLAIETTNVERVMTIALVIEPHLLVLNCRDIQFTLWRAFTPHPQPSGQVIPRPADYRDEDEEEEEEDDEYGGFDDDEEDMERVVDAEIIIIERSDEDDPLLFSEYEVRSLPHLSSRAPWYVVRFMLDRPFQLDFSLLDFFLRKKERYVLHPLEVGMGPWMEGNEDKIQLIRERLNPSQLRTITNAISNQLNITIGPPGTGKSTTAAWGIVWLALKAGGPIVVTCPSNFACQVIYDKLVTSSRAVEANVNIIRMFSKSRERRDIKRGGRHGDPNQLHIRVRNSIENEASERVRNLLRRHDEEGIAYITRSSRKLLRKTTIRVGTKALSNCDIIVCTVGAANDSRLECLKQRLARQRKRITALIIDEASLLTIPETLQLLTLMPLRVWLCGDGAQLPPTIMNESAKMAALDVSWLEMLKLTEYVRTHGERVHSLINVQYRMPAELARVVSRFMYEQQVVSSEGVLERNYAQMEQFRLLRVNFPELTHHNVGVFTYNGFQDSTDGGSHSFYNMKEVAITELILRDLDHSGIDMSTVVVIAMYTNQVGKLLEMIRRVGGNFLAVTIATVDSYQGKESSIIIANFVRSNRDCNVGFLKEARRTNVCISRAIDYALLVVDVNTFANSRLESFEKLFEAIRDEGVIRSTRYAEILDLL